MIALALSLIATALLATIPLQLHGETKLRRQEREVERLTAPLPPPRQRLAFPEPLTPMDLPPRDATVTYQGPSRMRELAGRHRVGTAAGTQAQQVRWNTPTGQFWLIVEALGDLDEPCSHCAAPEDGERPHAGCPGCSCPCSVAPTLPAGVEGHAIAGGTR